MSTDRPRDEPTTILDAVEKMDERLEKLRGDLRTDTIERLDENSTDEQIDKAIAEALRRQWNQRKELKGDSFQILTANESRLFEIINAFLSPEKKTRWDQLVSQRDEESLTEEEHQELIAIGEELEALNVKRLQALDELAKLRGIKFEALCRQIEFSPT